VAIDDIELDTDPRLEEHFVKIDPIVGLDEISANLVITMLNITCKLVDILINVIVTKCRTGNFFAERRDICNLPALETRVTHMGTLHQYAN